MNKKKAIAIFVAVSTFASNVPVLGANFTDINNVPWEGAKTYINSVADKGIMVGDYNSSGQLVFRSRDGVTYCETMQLVYALIQKTKGTSVTADVQTKWTSVMNGYNIPTWAQPAIAYGLENGIVTISDIPGFVNSSGKSVNATRQNVAIMFGRALKDYGTFNQNATISFKDAASVNAIAVPFIAHLNSLGIISGDDLGNFKPTNSINRAEMAVIVSKAYDTMSTPAVTTGSFSGEVTSVESVGSTTVITVKGDTETKSFSGNSTTAVLRDTNKILISALVVGDKVLVSYKGQDISSVLVTTSASTTTTASEVTGTYVSMSSSNIKISVNGTTKTYTYAGGDYSNVNFYVENASSTYTKFLNAATTNKTIKLVLNSAGDITKAYVESESKGTFVSIATTNIKLKV
ncbi:MAG: S-layer homology domain-containing protein, partial [Anaerotignaceae bacterium]